MAKVLVPLANGCEELEAVTVIDLLRRAGVEVTVAGLEKGAVKASRGTVLVPDIELNQVCNEQFDMIVLPGGLPGADYLAKDEILADIIQSMHQRQAHIGAICAAPKVLAKHGCLNNKRATAYPGVLTREEFPEVLITEEALVVDGNIITSKGPGTAMVFALKLIEILCGHDKKQLIMDQLMSV
jgi:4-methyl-5(b-hydroxyethyl)-thiazole monophosphate biosynthesis